MTFRDENIFRYGNKQREITNKDKAPEIDGTASTAKQGYGVGGFWVESDFFVRVRLWKSNWIIFYITLLSWKLLLKMVQFLMKLLSKQIILAVHHGFYLVLVATKFLTVKFHPRYVKESEILERLESGVGHFGKVGVGVGHFSSDPATLLPSSTKPKRNRHFRSQRSGWEWCKASVCTASSARSQSPPRAIARPCSRGTGTLGSNTRRRSPRRGVAASCSGAREWWRTGRWPTCAGPTL